MRKSERGFSAVEVVVVLAIVLAIGASGYLVYKHHKKAVNSTTANVTQVEANTPSGIAQNLTAITIQNASSESSTDSQYSSADSSTAASSNTAASDLGGAYNESNF